MRLKPHIDTARRQGLGTLALLLACGILGAPALEPAYAAAIPERCAGYGDLQSLSLTDWEMGLGLWTASTRNVANPANFNTPDWTVTGGLPDGRTGSAAFVPNLDSTCGDGNESGVLTLTSPSIVIPGGTAVPRISVKHWFEFEVDPSGSFYDGGNLRYSVNGGSFTLVPASAIEITSYQSTLAPKLDEFGVEDNTNPLAGQPAFTGTHDSAPSGSWVESRINLLGIASAGNTIRLRFDFGIDECGGAVGWYVDEVEFYYCPAELPPSNCGNGVINGPEQCDDGNNFIGDGCSNTCQVEPGWLCAAPTTPAPVPDSSFEAGTPNPFWTEDSNKARGTPICEIAVCGTAGGTGPSEGDFWVYLGGGPLPYQESSVSQSIVIPSRVSKLTFDLEIPSCDSADDYFEVLIDGNRELLIDGSDDLCGVIGYSRRTVDIDDYADGSSHHVEFHSETFSENGGVSRFFIDAVELPGKPSVCRRQGTSLTLIKNVINDDGGEALTSNWNLSAAGPSGFSGPGPVAWGGTPFTAGTYDLSESGAATGYAASTWDCDGGTQIDGDTVSVGFDEHVVCAIDNDDTPPTLTVVNSIVNDNGGPITDPDAFGLSIDGLPEQFDIAHVVDIGDHQVSQAGVSGYTAGVWGGDCGPDGAITLHLGQEAICTITNDDIDSTRLTLANAVTNDNGGSAQPADWTLGTIGPKPFSGNGPLVENPPNFSAGVYDLYQSGGPAGYGSSTWLCEGGAQLDGDTISLTLGDVATCTIMHNDIGPTLRVMKSIVNNNGGTVVDPNAFGLRLNGSPVLDAAVNPVGPGSHTVSEDGLPHYQAGLWSGDCNPDGSITLALGESATCSITNDDAPALLTVVNHIINDNGGTITNADLFNLRIDGTPALNGVAKPVSSGIHTVSQIGLSQYLAGTWGGDCNPDGTITLELGQAATCTITNDDITPTLKVVKTVINDNGGTVQDPNAFGLRIDGVLVSHDAVNVLDAGAHVVSEDGLQGYSAGIWGGDCSTNGNIILKLAEDAVCTITNNDSNTTQLALFVQLTNDDGGTALASSWTLTATGPGTFSGPGPFLSSGAGLLPGTYDLSLNGPAGYTFGPWVCNGTGQIDADTVGVALGKLVDCSISGSDIAPVLTVENSVTNNDGGTASANAFGLRIDGNPVSNGASVRLQAGNHNVSADGLAGYEAGLWGGDCNADGSISLAVGEEATCTISHDDIAPTLRLFKTIVNNNEGTITDPNAFGLRIDGVGVLHDTAYPVDAGNHTVSEVGLPGYTPSAWGAPCNADGTITLALGQDATCAITNEYLDTTSLTLVKQVINNNGGTAQGSDWTLNAAGPMGFSGSGPIASSGPDFVAGTYDLSESDGLPGYNASGWVCVGGNQTGSSIDVAQGESVTCTITNDDIDTTSLTLVNEVTNNDGGAAQASAWTLGAVGPRPFSGGGPTVPSPAGFAAGDYELYQSGGPAGYSASNWVCEGGTQLDTDTIRLALGEVAICTIVNDDIPPTLKVVKTIVNNNGGTVNDPNAFGLMIDDDEVLHDTTYPVTAGPHSVSETGLAGYAAGNWGGDCAPDGSVDLALGQNATCTITNNDIPPSLTLNKVVTNNNGGAALPSAWTLTANGPTAISGPGAAGSTDVQSGPNFVAGTYSLSESTGPAGYTASAWSCSGGSQNGSQLTLGIGQSATCTIVNNDLAPSLTLNKVVSNDNGGTSLPSAWVLTASGPTPLSGPGAAGSNDVQSGPNFAAGTYTLSESAGPAGYTASAWTCTGGSQNGNQITLGLGQSAACSITNDDNAPSLTLNKVVTNNNGGTASASEWTLTATGPSLLSGPGPSVSSGPGLKAGTYDLSESGGPAGYAASAWVCSGGSQNGSKITLSAGQSASCTIANNDIAPRLTLVKQVINDNGGTAIAPNWTLTATGPSGFSGSGPSVTNGAGFKAGTYSLSESGGPSGYAASAWSCSGGEQEGADTVSLLPGQVATCTITNNDRPPGLTLVMEITNDNGGTAVAANWTLTATGPTGFSGSGPTVTSAAGFDAGNYSLSVSGPAGYTASSWSCSGGNQNGSQVELELGQTATCTIALDDDAPSLTLNKLVTNNNGGAALPSAWTLTASGPTPLSGPGAAGSTDVQSGPNFAAGTYTLSESVGPAGYTASAWNCSGGSQNGNQITLGIGQSATCTIVNDDAAPSLTLNKVVINDNGGTALPSAWTLMAVGPTTLSGPGAAGNSDVQSGPGFDAGTYTLSESAGPAGYTAGTWSCSGGSQNGSQVTLGLGQSAVCTITNNDQAPSLILNKIVVNDNGGTALPSAWTISATGGPTPISGPGAPGSVDVQSGLTFTAGTYTLSESTGPAGYSASAWACTGGSQSGNQITLGLGQSATCAITNDDLAPSLTLNKVVTNNNGGTALPSAWTLTANGPTPISGPGAAGNSDVQSGPNFAAGTYTLSETGGPAGYAASSWSCNGGSQNGNQLTLKLGESAACAITNNDVAPGLTLVKVVTNNNGGAAEAGDWTLAAAGPSPFSGPGPSVSNGANFQTGSYKLSESGGPSGYAAGAWNCDAGTMVNADTVNLALGQLATCTIVNDDEGPGLTLVKQVINDNGGEAVPADWTLTAVGPTGFSGPGPIVSNAPGFEAGTYTLSESTGPAGYNAGNWTCDGGSQQGNTITLTPGQAATCTITNNDTAPSLALHKVVTNNNGGTAVAANWTLTATGPSSFSGAGPTVANGSPFKAGSYNLSEFGPAGYEAGDWVCTGGSQVDGDTVNLALGESAVCTITNNDIAPSLTLVKQVTNDDGGTAVAADWTLTASGPSTLSGLGPNVSSGGSFKAGTYDLAESGGPVGYVPSSWDCSGGSQIDADTVTLGLGQTATCTIINDDAGPGLTLVKQVKNDNGGTALPSAWTLTASGPTGFSGPGPSVSNGDVFEAGTYNLSESTGPQGYTASNWDCIGGVQQDGDTVIVAPGEAVTCTITNDDNAPSLTLVKKVINDNGGSATPSAWTLTASGPSPLNGAGPNVSSGPGFKAGTYNLSESAGPQGYTASAWVCSGVSQDDADTVTLGLGESATCTITNNDVVQGELIFGDGFELE